MIRIVQTKDKGITFIREQGGIVKYTDVQGSGKTVFCFNKKRIL